MSMLNTSSDEPSECPLCMELLEMDDLSFYPCTCGYQVRPEMDILELVMLRNVFGTDLSVLLAPHSDGREWALPSLPKGLSGKSS